MFAMFDPSALCKTHDELCSSWHVIEGFVEFNPLLLFSIKIQFESMSHRAMAAAMMTFNVAQLFLQLLY